MSARTCPTCGEVGAEGATWCEACGGELGVSIGPPCVDCGAESGHIVQGYCGHCGRKQPGNRDHLTEDLGVVVAVTDRGKRHHRNEDAFAIGLVGDIVVAIVCDGVSTTDDPQHASLAAAGAARDHLVAALGGDAGDIEGALVEATALAQRAAAAVPPMQGGHGPASTTFVATVLVPGEDYLTSWTAWLGDSRSYWLHDGGADQLTIDDAWGLAQIASGAMTLEEVHADPRAQSITRWLGADAIDPAPSIHVAEHEPGGMLLVCSDGLWKYVPEPAQLFELVESTVAASTLDLAELLIAFANESGGHDNTTIVIAPGGMRHDVHKSPGE